jgi:hypothetical protein
MVKLISIHPILFTMTVARESPALEGPSYLKASLKILPNRGLKSRMPNYEKFTFIISPNLSRTTLFIGD